MKTVIQIKVETKINKSGNIMYGFKNTSVVPAVSELIDFPEKEENIVFINSVTLNPKDVNAQLYSQFNKDTLSSFIYAFAIQIGRLYFSQHYIAKQLEANARRVERLCYKKNLCLSEAESSVIKFCENFNSCKYTNQWRVEYAESLKEKLKKLY